MEKQALDEQPSEDTVLFESAVLSLNTIRKQEICLIKSFCRPPPICKKIMHVLYIIVMKAHESCYFEDYMIGCFGKKLVDKTKTVEEFLSLLANYPTPPAGQTKVNDDWGPIMIMLSQPNKMFVNLAEVLNTSLKDKFTYEDYCQLIQFMENDPILTPETFNRIINIPQFMVFI